ncbi:MAG: hypothetical protein J4G09_08320 [Proteobacteria bacterium]|nr:hypothetical protein [Pseudomonadota bacterium]
MLDGMGWIAAVFGMVLAGYFGLQAREEKRQAAQARGQAEELASERDAALARAERRGQERRERSDELTRLRRKLEKLRRQPEETRERAEREQKLEGQLAQSRRDTAAALRERDAAREDRRRAEAALAQERERQARLNEARQQQRADEDLAQARLELERSGQAVARLEEDLARARKRADNLDKVYVVLRGQYALAQEELRAKDARIERLEALRVALAETPASQSSPAGPGPEAEGESAPREHGTSSPIRDETL